MKADFDRAAPTYDAAFTLTTIGKLQRGLVYRQLSQILNGSPKKILEINCGTGEDALWLANQNHNVTATDLSEVMIDVAMRKSTAENPLFLQADINSIAEAFSNQKFDLIFSNFGGLNCLSTGQLEAFFEESAQVIASGGIMFLVIMPKNTLWESVYFIVKGKFETAFRRRKGTVLANVEGEKVHTYYYNPNEIVHLSKARFETKRVSPVGFFVPPSYLEPFFKNRPRLTRLLNNLEQKISNQSWLSPFADHYIIVLQKK